MSEAVIGTTHIVCGAGFIQLLVVYPSVPAWAHSSKPAAAGTVYVIVGPAGSAMLSACVGS